MLRPILAAAVLIALPGAAVAQDAAGGQAPQRIRNIQLTGAEACPKAQGDEIVVCSRINPNEVYRIPKELRDGAEIKPQNQSWVNRTAAADAVSRQASGLPNTCSPVGTGGQTGCALAYGRAFAAEKRAAEKNDAMVP